MNQTESISGAGEKKERSDALLPADDDSADDGRLEVAEEVNLDQQSDAARRVGQPPAAHVGTLPGSVADALAESLAPPPPGSADQPEPR